MNDYTHKDFRRAWITGDAPRRQYGRAQGAKDRAEIAEALELLLNGTHPSHPGIKLSRLEFDVKNYSGWPTCDAAFRRAPTFDDDDIDLIMNALKSLMKRTIALEALPMFRAVTHGPAEPLTPRVMSPSESYTAAQQAYIASQAKFNQHRAATAMPTVYPNHPEFAAKKAQEQAEATRDARHHAHTMIARTNHLTFADGKQLRGNMRQNTFEAEAEAARELRDREAALMSDMVQTIQTELGDYQWQQCF